MGGWWVGGRVGQPDGVMTQNSCEGVSLSDDECMKEGVFSLGNQCGGFEVWERCRCVIHHSLEDHALDSRSSAITLPEIVQSS